METLDQTDFIRKANRAPQTVRAELIGHNACAAYGITARAAAPVLALCRQLIEAGFDPAAPLYLYRGNVLCLRVRSIGDGAGLILVTAGNGCPILAKEPGQKGFTEPPARFSKGAATSLHGAAKAHTVAESMR